MDSGFLILLRFQNEAYIRRGQNKKKMKDCPDLERELWGTFSRYEYEKQIAMENLSEASVLGLLDYKSYFRLLNIEIPGSREGIIEALLEDRMLQRNDFGSLDILNLGAILFARRLDSFDGMRRKAIRIIQYEGNNKMTTARGEQVIMK